MIYYSAYFQLVKNILFFFAITGGKCALEGRSKLSYKHIANDLEMKMRMVHKYECGQSLSALLMKLVLQYKL
jgi:hypothetical protein